MEWNVMRSGILNGIVNMQFSDCDLLVEMCIDAIALNKNWLIHSAAFLWRQAEMNAFSSDQD